MSKSMCVVFLVISVCISYSAFAGCEQQSWTPEVFTFYGDGEQILQNMASDARMKLTERRIYLVTVEGPDGAEVRLFQREGKSTKFHVWSWKGKTLGDLDRNISAAILENRGVACVGVQIKSIVTKDVYPKDLGAVPAPVNARAAFAHGLQSAKGFTRATVYLAC